MTTTNDELSDALDSVRRAQAQWVEDRRIAAERRRTAVQKALDAGETLTNIGKAMGLSHARVAQIRDELDK